jgi:hypothetical protein
MPGALLSVSDLSRPANRQNVAALPASAMGDIGISGNGASRNAKYNIIKDVPQNSVKLTTSDGSIFSVPPETDFKTIYEAGKNIQDVPLLLQPSMIGANVGQGGLFDLQRSGNNFYSTYTPASNFAVGVFMKGAGYSWPEVLAVGSAYGLWKSQDVKDAQIQWWKKGYDAASNGKFP